MTTVATPRQVFDLVSSLLSDTWPVLEHEAVALLESHSCEVLLAHRNTERAVRVGRWHCPELDIWGAWTTCPPRGIGLSAYILDTSADNETLSSEFGALTDEFTVHLGEPEFIDRNPYSPRMSWTWHDLVVSVDTYTREHRSPLIEVSIRPLRMTLPHPIYLNRRST